MYQVPEVAAACKHYMQKDYLHCDVYADNSTHAIIFITVHSEIKGLGDIHLALYHDDDGNDYVMSSGIVPKVIANVMKQKQNYEAFNKVQGTHFMVDSNGVLKIPVDNLLAIPGAIIDFDCYYENIAELSADY